MWEAAGEDCGDVATDEVKRQKRDGSPIEMNHKMMFYWGENTISQKKTQIWTSKFDTFSRVQIVTSLWWNTCFFQKLCFHEHGFRSAGMILCEMSCVWNVLCEMSCVWDEIVWKELCETWCVRWVVCGMSCLRWVVMRNEQEATEEERRRRRQRDAGPKTKKTRWAREPKSKAAHSTPFLRNLVVWEATLCTKPRQDLYWDTAPQFTTASCVSYV